MKLYLMQHAIAYTTEEDSSRALTTIGVEQAKTAALGIKRSGLKFDLIIASSKRRSQQTAALVAEAVRYPYSDIMTSDTVLPQQQPEALIELLQKESSDCCILVVSHMPYLAKLASELMGGGELVFENVGLTCFDMSGPKSAALEFHLQAKQLAR